MANVLFEVVQVADTKLIEEESGKPVQAGMRRVEADLEIDQVGPAVVADNDVLVRLQIDIGNAASMHRPKSRPGEWGRSLDRLALVLRQRMARDEGSRHRVAEPPAICVNRPRAVWGPAAGLAKLEVSARCSRSASRRPSHFIGKPHTDCTRLNLHTIRPAEPA